MQISQVKVDGRMSMLTCKYDLQGQLLKENYIESDIYGSIRTRDFLFFCKRDFEAEG